MLEMRGIAWPNIGPRIKKWAHDTSSVGRIRMGEQVIFPLVNAQGLTESWILNQVTRERCVIQGPMQETRHLLFDEGN